MGRSFYTVITLVKGASFSLNKMGVDFLVYGAIVAYFAFVVRIVDRKKSRESLTQFRGKSKKKLNCMLGFLLIMYFIFKAHLVLLSDLKYIIPQSRSPF